MKKLNRMGSDSTARNIIGQGTIIKGDITSSGDFRIDGQLIGSISSDGKIVIGQTGIVEGEVHCKQADISGRIDAKIEVAELTVLKATANFRGHLITDKIAIEVGAQFTGECKMKSANNENRHGKEEKTKK